MTMLLLKALQIKQLKESIAAVHPGLLSSLMKH